jgi:hypothetical protein
MLTIGFARPQLGPSRGFAGGCLINRGDSEEVRAPGDHGGSQNTIRRSGRLKTCAARWSVWFLCALNGVFAQGTRLPLPSIAPGTEAVQLVTNGDFQAQGTVTSTNTHPSPTGWSRLADMFADPGRNMVPTDGGVVAQAWASGNAAVCKYQRTVTLQPATDYILSGYLWNLGDSANHVTTVIDLNDAPNEPQITLSWSDPGADLGYFVYRGFNTTNTGTSVTVRLFYDSLVGTGTAAKYYPVAAQWDNVAITKASDFVPPQTGGTQTNVLPTVSISSPSEGAALTVSNQTVVPISAAATDPDGTVSKVEFFANGAKVGETTSSPFTVSWSGMSSGSYSLTARATDNLGAMSLSAPVSVSITVPLIPSLHIELADGSLALSWPTSLTAVVLQGTTNLSLGDWQMVTNAVALNGSEYTVLVPKSASQRYFRLGSGVDPNTLTGKMLMGYQGWFACPGDGSPLNRWVHWFDTQTPTAANVTVDFWPDVSELDPDELFNTQMTMPDGSPAKVYAAWNQKTVVRHFKWMKDNNLDGVFLQRFTSELSNSKNFAWRNQVTSNVWAGAETYGRVFGIMYDVSGQDQNTLVATITNDWAYLANTMHVTNSPRYIRHRGKPVVTIWGFGFDTRSNTPDQAITVVNFFKNAGCTVMGGIPTYWRTLDRDSQTNAAWADAYRSFDVISPWSVTRYRDVASADSYKTGTLIPDLNEATAHGIDYMPVVFPGFSWTNVNGGPFNYIPRYGGTFYWSQIYNAVSARCTMLYGAMFDELNEGTSMFKMAANTNDLPAQGAFVPLNIDGYTALPSDWYLRLADQATRMLRGTIPLTNAVPISP